MAHLSRRDFLENSLLTSAAAALAGSAPSLVRAQGETVDTNSILRVAVLGVNGRGQDHLNGFMRRKDCEVVAVCDPDEQVGQKKGVEVVEKATGKAPVYHKDLRRVMEDKSIDIVSIATPNHWHSLAAIWALQAGKDVYVEKPVSHNVQEGRRVFDAARKYNRICQTGTQSRSMPGTREFMDFLHSGGIGAITLARGLCYKNRPSIGARGTYAVPESVDYDLWCGPAPTSPLSRPRFHYDWHWQWEYGNGDLGNQGIHQMDLARWGLGKSDVGVSVLSYGGRLGYTDAGETANTQVSFHDYGDKLLVFEVRGLPSDSYKGAGVGVIFEGADGYAVMPSYSGGVIFDKSGNQVKKFSGEADHYDNFIKAVRSRKISDLNADILEGHLSSALCHLGNISYRLGEVVDAAEVSKRLGALKSSGPAGEALETFSRVEAHLKANNVDLGAAKMTYGPLLQLDPVAEVFTGELSQKANPLLTREYRKGYEVPATAEKV
ncbi:MAG: Gfo/Idh/MocA family protein [Planctomycetaceae bacterium]